MKIEELEALAIATRFVTKEYKESSFFIVDGEYKISFEKDGFGHTVLGLVESYWSVTFTMKSSAPNTFDSGSEYFIVLVGAESGEPHWLPVM